MTKSFFRNALCSSTALVAAGAFAAPALAQEPATQSEEVVQSVAPSQPIVITGSRIARPDVESASPVTVVSGEQIEATGTVRVEDLLNSLPQIVGGQNAFIANGATGTATVNLRNLGSVRTLVLVNGRRLQPGSTVAPVADINQIPGALVERIDVLTGGASATYGADAVAGVVNFVMNTDFTGVNLDASMGFYQHNNESDQVVTPGGDTIGDLQDAAGINTPTGSAVDGRSLDVTLSVGAGTDDGRGHVVAYVGYRDIEEIFQGDRDYSACALTGSGTSVGCGGSSTAPNATIADPNFDLFGALVANGSDDFGYGSNAYQPYNYAPINYFQRPDQRFTGGAFAEYEVSRSFTPYAEFMFMDDRSVAQIAQSGTFFADQYNIPCDSPLLTEGQGDLLCDLIDGDVDRGDFVDTNEDGVADTDPTGAGVVPLYLGKRNVEGGPRFDDRRHTSYRIVAGARGDISDTWRYDVYAQYGTTVFSQTYNNDFSRSRLRNALDVVSVDSLGEIVPNDSPDVADIVCRSVVTGGDPNCVPYNPFQGGGLVDGDDVTQGITQGAIDYVNIPLQSRGETEETVVSGFVAGDVFSLGTADPWGLVLGAEYRDTAIRTYNDLAFQTGDGAGQGGPQLDVDGSYDVAELFTEIRAPLLQDMSFAQYLGIEAGYRFSDYSIDSVGTTHTFKILGEWQPVDALKVRGGFNRAVRAPNVLELFTPNQIALWSGTDPCAGANPTFTAEQCENTGVPTSAYGSVAESPASQYNQLIGGNAELEEEKADTWTAGAVIDGTGFGFTGFVATVDYFNIEVTNAISPVGDQTILNQCGLTGDPFFCDNVFRNAGSYNLWVGSDQQDGFIADTTQNIGGFKTSGIDVAASYNMPIGPGSAFINFAGTWVNEFQNDTGIDPAAEEVDGVYDCAGLFGPSCGPPQPEWRHQVRLGYDADFGVGLSLRWRYFGPVDQENNSEDPDLGGGAGTVDDVFNIPSQSYFDFSTNFAVSDEFDLRIGVNNVFDEDPYLVTTNYLSGFGSGNTEVTVYDPVGRYFFVNGSLRF